MSVGEQEYADMSAFDLVLATVLVAGIAITGVIIYARHLEHRQKD